jgi:anti-sigma regulatory factor (Ser/Thr protein kinase)
MNGEVARTEARAPELDLYLDAVPGAVPAARHSAARWAATEGANGPDLYRICLAVSEAVTNALVHAYSHRDADGDGPAPDKAPDDTTRQIRLRGLAGSGELTIFVADKGCGIGRALASPGLGLGLTVIDESCEELAIRSGAGGGIELEMRFRLRPWSDSPGPSEDVAEVSAGSVTEPIFGAGPSSGLRRRGPGRGPVAHFPS